MRGDATLRGLTGYGLRRALSRVHAEDGAALAEFGLRMVSFSVLTVIADNPGLRQTDLAGWLAIERPNLVPILDGLEGRGLIERGRDAEDRRAVALTATSKGRAVLAEALPALRAAEDRAFADLTGRERDALIATLRRVEDQGRSDDDQLARA